MDTKIHETDTPLYEFQREACTKELLNEALPLLELHSQEVSHFKDIPLSIDRDFYVQAEELGMLRIYTVRREGQLVGYAVFFLKTNPHYSKSLQAVQDILFMHPAHRGRGMKFMLWCEVELKKEGAEVVYHHVKIAPELNFSKMLERMGYVLIDYVYGKKI